MKDELLYSLLPEFHRQLDERGGMPLRALLAAIEEQRAALEQDIAVLYDNWFIETCEDWALPRLAALLGVEEGLAGRSAIANTLACRRRKGTFAALERRLADLSGWTAMAGMIRNPSHDRPALRIGVWRQTAYPVRQATARRIGPGRYTFHPMGIDIPLFQVPVANYDVERPLGIWNVPARLERPSPHPVQALASGSPPTGGTLPSVYVLVAGSQGATSPGPGELPVVLGNLSQWEDGPIVHQLHAGAAIVDPVLGRLAIPAPLGDARIAVSYAYGFSADLGGGPYPRQLTFTGDMPWVAFVHQDAAGADAGQRVFSTVSAALQAFRETPGSGVIRIMDSATYRLAPGDTAGAPPEGCQALPEGRRTLVIEAQDGEAPCLRGTLRIAGADPGMNVTLHGLWIDGPLRVEGNLVLNVRHCTVRPPFERESAHRHGIHAMAGEQSNLRVNLEFSICGPIRLPAGSAGLWVSDAIVDGGHHAAVAGAAGPGPPTHLTRTTVFGSVEATELESRDVLVGSEAGIFVSRRYGDPGYAQLRRDAPPGIPEGATNGSELGAFNCLRQAQRERLLESAIAEFVPDGLASTVVFET